MVGGPSIEQTPSKTRAGKRRFSFKAEPNLCTMIDAPPFAAWSEARSINTRSGFLPTLIKNS
tara:strand:- start:10367 stop:10552 length:186 start_codon:yes stop_codon:yes gene_type:complete